jgi:hypothetical protein
LLVLIDASGEDVANFVRAENCACHPTVPFQGRSAAVSPLLRRFFCAESKPNSKAAAVPFVVCGVAAVSSFDSS